jgi:hypothetical protein
MLLTYSVVMGITYSVLNPTDAAAR